MSERTWKTDTPSLSALDLVLESSGPIRVREYIPKGPYNEAIAVKAYHIGKQFVIAIVAVGEKNARNAYASRSGRRRPTNQPRNSFRRSTKPAGTVLSLFVNDFIQL